VLIKDFKNCKEIIAGDGTLLREIIHARETGNKIRYSIAHAIVKPGEKSLPHKLKSSEIYYIIEGEGMVFINGEYASVQKKQAIYIPPNSEQWIENTGSSELKFLCIVDPAWKLEDKEIS
jgi:mannose-6-phosphate isomerase-like protein (cupin superfamily)